VKHAVSLKAIEAQWDELVRLTASIEAGLVTADVALARLASAAAAGEPLPRPADHLGRLLRTMFLCDYLAQEDFRRELHRMLDQGEAVHPLQRVIYYGPIPTRLGRRHEEAMASSGSLTLLTNVALARTTYRVQKVLRLWAAESSTPKRESAPDWIRYVIPARSELINYRGVFTFVERYLHQLVVPRANRQSNVSHVQ
jgi:TnpA family transposase